MCKPYKFNASELIIPNFNIFNTLCKSYDKTNMFIFAMIRIIILYILYQIIIKHISKNLVIHCIFIILFIIDLVSIIIILSKKPKTNDKSPIAQ